MSIRAFAACVLVLMSVRLVDAALPASAPAMAPAASQPRAGAATSPRADTPAELARIASWKGDDPNARDDFNFVVLSDRTGGAAPGQWEAAIAQVNLLRPDFAVFVGDLIEGYTRDTDKLKAMWDEIDAMTSKLDAPLFYTPGNHDITYDEAIPEFIRRHGMGGRTYGSFDYRSSHFVILDDVTALRKPEFAAAELAWLAKDLDAAKDARHVFVFFHMPLFDDQTLWPEMSKLFDPAKTIIFNGHTHILGQAPAEQSAIRTYVLAATAAKFGSIEADTGKLPMFAVVHVGRAQPTVALVPMNQIMGVDFIASAEAARKLDSQLVDKMIDPRGQAVEFPLTNTLNVPLAVHAEWKAPLWKISPMTRELSLDAGQKGSLEFDLNPQAATQPAKADLELTFRYARPNGQKVELHRALAAYTYASMDIAPVKSIAIDGDLGDWAAVKSLVAADRQHVARGGDDWSGPKDGSFAFRVGHDDQRLYVAVDVTDDNVGANSSTSRPWIGDGIEFFWDSRPADKQTGLHGPGTGHLGLRVPEDSANPVVAWNMAKRTVPKGLQAAYKRTAEGYAMEFSMPLEELGVSLPLQAGRKINLDLQLDDRDGDSVANLTASGFGSGSRQTRAYLRCTMK